MKSLCVLTLLFLIPLAAAKTYYVESYIKVNFLGAYQLCARDNRQLATVNSAEEQRDIEQAIRDSGVEKTSLWISGMSAGQPFQYVWMSTAQPVRYTRWSPRDRQPNIANGCLTIWPVGESLDWGDWTCDHKFNFICEDKQTTHVVNISV